MANFLLIHGASHGAWCWDRLIPHLQEQGHVVRAIDLPAHGDDRTPPKTVRISDYVEALLYALQPDSILVGHSFGGFPISLAAARAPEKVRALVYVCALVPRPGQSFADFRAEAISAELSGAQVVDRDAGVTRVIPEIARDVFYSGCTKADSDFALARVTPQPIGVMTEKLEFQMPDTPRHYIRCLEDRVVLPAYQHATSEGWPHVHDMACGHSPFLEDPAQLAAILNQIAAETD